MMKVLNCERCSVEAERTGTRQRFCIPCAKVVEHERGYKRRRKAGMRVFSKDGFCDVCSCPIKRTMRWQKYCSDCAKDKIAEARLARERAKSRRLGIPAIGSVMTCTKCKSDCTRVNGAQLYCRKCADEVSAARLKSEKYRSYMLEWQKKRRKSDPRVLLRARMSMQVRRGLKHGKMGKSWCELVGYTVTELRNHIEKQFKDGMNWSNIDQWEIDHRRPVSSFDFETADDPDFCHCWGLSNLQPMWRSDNRRKSNKILVLV